MLERLAERRERMHRVDDVVDGQPELHRERRLGDHVGRAGPDHVDADDFVRLVVFHHLHEPAGVLDGLRLRDVRHVDRSTGARPVLGHVLGLGRPDGRDLGAREHDGRDRVVIDGRGLVTEGVPDGVIAFLRRDGLQHRLADTVTGRVDFLVRRPELLVDDYRP